MIVGSGPLEDQIRAEAARLGVSLKMVGFLNQSQLGEPYALADCLTLPSDFPETWGLVVNEALATGLPCVVSNAVGCAPDLIRDGETGYVYPLDDIEALAMTLAKVRHRKAEGHDWGPACRALVAAYSYDAMTAGVVRAAGRFSPHSPGPEPDWSAAPRPHRRLLRPDGDCRRSRAHDVRGAAMPPAGMGPRATRSSTAGRTSGSRRWPRRAARAGRSDRTGTR